MTVKDKMIVYIYRKGAQLENAKKEIDMHRRYYPMDSLDLYEAMRQDIEIQCWEQFVNDIYNIVINCK